MFVYKNILHDREYHNSKIITKINYFFILYNLNIDQMIKSDNIYIFI